MRTLTTTNGFEVCIDDLDYEEMSRHQWRAQKDRNTYYAVRMGVKGGKTVCIRMHRQILGFPACMIDHKNRNGLDNQRDNLRPATNSQNQANSQKHADSKNPHKGVWWNAGRKKWMVRATVNGSRKTLGYFSSLEVAANKYRQAIQLSHGDFCAQSF